MGSRDRLASDSLRYLSSTSDALPERTVRRTTSVERMLVDLRTRIVDRSNSSPLELPARSDKPFRRGGRRKGVEGNKTSETDPSIDISKESCSFKLGQVVRYHDRRAQKWINDARVVSVDGGGDYTIRYLDRGTEIEKLTRADRLEPAVVESPTHEGATTSANPQNSRSSLLPSERTCFSPGRSLNHTLGGERPGQAFKVNELALYYHAAIRTWIACNVAQAHGHEDYTIQFKGATGEWVERDTTGDRLRPLDNHIDSDRSVATESRHQYGKVLPSKWKSTQHFGRSIRSDENPWMSSGARSQEEKQPPDQRTRHPSPSSLAGAQRDRCSQTSRLSRSPSPSSRRPRSQTEEPPSTSTYHLYRKNDQVRYYHKLSGRWYDRATVLSVHPQAPGEDCLYTIQFTDDTGSMIEKVTAGDRLTAVVSPPPLDAKHRDSRRVESTPPSTQPFPDEGAINGATDTEKPHKAMLQGHLTFESSKNSENSGEQIDGTSSSSTALRGQQNTENEPTTIPIEASSATSRPSSNQFFANQLVRFYYEPSELWIDAVLDDAHLKDGQEVTYTVRFLDESGSPILEAATFDNIHDFVPFSPSGQLCLPRRHLKEQLNAPSASSTEHIPNVQASPRADLPGPRDAPNGAAVQCRGGDSSPPASGPTLDQIILAPVKSKNRQEVKSNCFSGDSSASFCSTEGEYRTARDVTTSAGQENEPRELSKRTMLEGQRKREEEAALISQLAKNQRVRYYHKCSRTWFEAHVVAVHFDDGVDEPYYTIRYSESLAPFRTCSQGLQERQTTTDRLEVVDWDDEKSWSVLLLASPGVRY